jgi:uncharacterized protein YjiS (DUF1127 family)
MPTAIFRACKRLARTVRLWVSRASERRNLSDLDDHLLRDLGLSRVRVRLEGGRPFWLGEERDRLRARANSPRLVHETEAAPKRRLKYGS